MDRSYPNHPRCALFHAHQRQQPFIALGRDRRCHLAAHHAISHAQRLLYPWLGAIESLRDLLTLVGLTQSDSTFEHPIRIIRAMPFRMLSVLSKWPVIRQIRERKDGTGLEAMSEKTRAMHARIDDAQVARSICPYCGVGCGQLVFHKDGKLVSIEGDPESPISQGNLCPTWSRTVSGNRGSVHSCTNKTARLSITPRRSVISEARRSITKKIILSKNYSPEAWEWSVCPTRPGYDIAARCPVWAPPSAGAELQPRNKI